LVGRGHGHRFLARGLPVADARQEIGDRIIHAHLRSPAKALPARLRQARNLAAHRRRAQLVPAEAEAAIEAARASGDRAATAQPHRARIARQLPQTYLRSELLLVGRARIADDLLQLVALSGIALHRLHALRLPQDHGFLSHRKTPDRYARSGKLNASSSARPAASLSAVVVSAMSIPRTASI